MIKLIKKGLLLTTIFAIQSLYAGTTPRIDLYGLKGKVQFKELKVFGSDKSKIQLARWKWVKGDSYALATFAGLQVNTWTQVGLKFTPTSTGKVRLLILGQPERNREGIIYFDNLEVKGAELFNQDFEEIDPSRKLPILWKRQNIKKNVETLAGYSREYKKNGNISALVHHDSRLFQTIEVEKDKPVIIEVWVYFKS